MGKWVRKAYETVQEYGNTVVMLVFARTDTAWFHDYIYHKAEIRFIRGRLKFGGSKTNAPAPSMLVIFKSGLSTDRDRHPQLKNTGRNFKYQEEES